MASTPGEKHHALIDGLTQLYDTLIAMQYISAADLLRPPHEADSLALDRLLQLGLERETVELAARLPALRNELTWGWQEEGTQLLPRSKAVNYFVQRIGSVGEEQMEDLRLGDCFKGENVKQLPPWLLKLTVGGDYGCHLLYNVRDQTIVEWYMLGRPFPDDHPSRPAADVLSQIIARFTTLEWVPYVDLGNRNPSRLTREILENPLVLQSLWLGQQDTAIRNDLPDFDTAIHMAGQPQPGQQHPLEAVLARDSLRERINRWRALQKLYRDCGWGSSSTSFDASQFVRRRIQWTAELRALKDEYSQDGPLSMACAIGTETEEQRARRESIIQRWEVFWAATAGDAAV